MRLLSLVCSGAAAALIGVALTTLPAASSGSIVTSGLTVLGQAPASASAAPVTPGPALKPIGTLPPGTVALDVPVQLTTLNSGAGDKVTRVYVLCAIASSPGVQIARVSLPKGSSIKGVPSGGSGSLLGQASATVSLDANASYAGPPVRVIVKPGPTFQGVAAKSYGCALIFNNALAANAPAADGTYRFAQSPFTPSTQGTLP